MTNFERLMRSKEDLAKQLVWEKCDMCFLVSGCQLEQRKKCLSETMEWLDKKSEINIEKGEY